MVGAGARPERPWPERGRPGTNRTRPAARIRRAAQARSPDDVGVDEHPGGGGGARASAPGEGDTAAQAAQHVYALVAGQWAACTVRTAAELGVMDAVAPEGSSLAELAAATGCDESGLRRLLRACQALGLVQVTTSGGAAGGAGEAADDVVRLTAPGGLLRADAPGSLRALARLQGTPGVWALWEALPEAVRTGTTTATSTLGAPLYEFLRAHPEEGRVFGRAMQDLTGLVEAEAARAVDLGDDAVVVDVGGGTGSFLASLLAAAPGARGTVLDTAETVAAADPSALPDGVGDRLVFAAGDFFAGVPRADWYVLKSVLSNWSDDDAVRLLRTCRRAAGPGARALVVEQLVGAAAPGEPDVAALMDMTLLVLTPGGSRELAGYDRLARAGGWQRVRVYPLPAGYAAVELEPDAQG